jgi:hypothetical protein
MIKQVDAEIEACTVERSRRDRRASYSLGAKGEHSGENGCLAARKAVSQLH